MTDDYKKGLVTGLAMQPLPVVGIVKTHTSGVECAEGIYAELIPAKVIIAREVNVE